MSSPVRLDDIDIRLLELLQESGRTSQHDLAQAVGLSSPAVGERLRKLEDRGVIRHFTVLLNPKLLGRDVTAFISVGIAGSQHFDDFREHVLAHPDVLECHSITGQGSHLIKIRTENTTRLELLLAEIQAWPGVQWTNTSIVLSTVKESGALRVRAHEGHGPPAPAQ